MEIFNKYYKDITMYIKSAKQGNVSYPAVKRSVRCVGLMGDPVDW